ncbi:hypothetical protein GCM10022245_34560 [Streptomyces mayteni]
MTASDQAIVQEPESAQDKDAESEHLELREKVRRVNAESESNFQLKSEGWR